MNTAKLFREGLNPNVNPLDLQAELSQTFVYLITMTSAGEYYEMRLEGFPWR